MKKPKSGVVVMAISNGRSFNKEDQLIAKWAIFMAKAREAFLVTDANIPIDGYNNPHRIIGIAYKGEDLSVIETIKSAFFLYNNYAKKEAVKEILIVTSPMLVQMTVRICKEIFQNTGIYIYGMAITE